MQFNPTDFERLMLETQLRRQEILEDFAIKKAIAANAIPAPQDELVCLIVELMKFSTENPEPLESEERNSYLGEHKARVREIGQRIHELGGFSFMQMAAQQIPRIDLRDLEVAWHGIGEWLS